MVKYQLLIMFLIARGTGLGLVVSRLTAFSLRSQSDVGFGNCSMYEPIVEQRLTRRRLKTDAHLTQEAIPAPTAVVISV